MSDPYPRIVQTVLDATDPRALAEFWRQFLGYHYPSAHEPPPPGEDDEQGRDWLNLRSPDGGADLAFQGTTAVRPSTWPDGEVPAQLHLDLMVTSVEELERHRQRALDLGARQLFDRSDDPDEPLYVFADPAGHPFCVFVH